MEREILNLYPIDYPFETLVMRVEKEKLILNPDFQRKYKWDKDGNERASRFIESCLMRIPLPACYLAENEDNKHLVIDGVQRITTIKKFFNDEFELEGLTIYPELNGEKFSDLGILKSELESTTIRCVVLRKENPKELINEIFARLNQGAVKLSNQEIRHAVYPGTFDHLLTELGDIQFIADFRNSKSKDDRSNEELALRFFALQSDLKTYESNLSKLLNEQMKVNQNVEIEIANQKKELFITSLDKCLKIFKQPFVNTNQKQPKQSVALYDLLMWSMPTITDEFIEAHKSEIETKFNELCIIPDFKKTMAGGLQQKSSILSRRVLWISKLQEINGYE